MSEQTNQKMKSIAAVSSLLKHSESPLVNYRSGTESRSFAGLFPIGYINILIGSTNSGKSRLMRILLNDGIIAIVEQKNSEDNIPDVVMILNYQIMALTEKYLSKSEAFRVLVANGHSQSGKEMTIGRLIHEFGFSDSVAANLFDFTVNALFFNELRSNIREFLDGRKNSAVVSLILDRVFAQLSVFSAERVHDVDITPSPARELLDEVRAVVKLLVVLKDLCSEATVECRQDPDRRIVFIPTLRTSYTLADSANRLMDKDVLSKNVRAQYLLLGRVDVFTGLELYDQLDRDVRGRRRQQLRAFERMLGDRFFNREEVEIIPEHPDATKARPAGDGGKDHGSIVVRIGTEERSIHMLGDGIQSLVMILYKIYLADNGTWFFIDEPEIGLHPGLQRVFLDCLTTDEFIKSQKYRFFFTTHSNHLIDLTLPRKDVSIFSFSRMVKNRQPLFIVRNASNDRLSVLSELGSLNSSVLMANCSIWVEGPSDRLYIRKFIELYCKKEKLGPFQEDIHYAFFEYAGSNIAHYVWGEPKTDEAAVVDDNADDEDIDDSDDDGVESEAAINTKRGQIRMQFLSNRVFLTADRDQGKSQKHEYWSNTQSENKGSFEYYYSPGQEIENLLSVEFLKTVLSRDDFRLTKAPPLGRKSGAVVQAQEIEKATLVHAEYCPETPSLIDSPENTQGVARYFAGKLGLKPSAMQSRKSQTGTFSPSYKKKISSLADDCMTVDNIGEPALQLAKRIYQFIKRHNPAPDQTSG